MMTVRGNLINVRMKQCPFYPSLFVQQIIGYGRWNPEGESCTLIRRDEKGKTIAVNPFLIIFVKLFNPERATIGFRRGLSRLLSNNLRIYKSQLIANQPSNVANLLAKEIDLLTCEVKLKSGGGKRNDRILFSIIDWTELVRSGSFTLRAELKDYDRKGRDFGFSKRTPARRSVDFCIASCIRDEPGTLHSILEALDPKATVASDTNSPFSFNIDYLITDYLGIYDLYHLEVYGSYTESGQNVRGAVRSRTENVQGMVAYHRPEESLPEGLVNSHDCGRLTKEVEQGGFELRELKEAVTSNIGSHLDAFESGGSIELSNDLTVSAFHRDADIDTKDGRRPLPVLNCPISRIAGCPSLQRVTGEDTPTRHEKYRVKFHLIMQDQPGALKTFIELVGRGEFSPSTGAEEQQAHCEGGA